MVCFNDGAIHIHELVTSKPQERSPLKTPLQLPGTILGAIKNPGFHLRLRRSLVGKRPAGFRGPSGWPQEVVLPFDSGDDCRIAANTWLKLGGWKEVFVVEI